MNDNSTSNNRIIACTGGRNALWRMFVGVMCRLVKFVRSTGRPRLRFNASFSSCADLFSLLIRSSLKYLHRRVDDVPSSILLMLLELSLAVDDTAEGCKSSTDLIDDVMAISAAVMINNCKRT